MTLFGVIDGVRNLSPQQRHALHAAAMRHNLTISKAALENAFVNLSVTL
jgi:hypothetical protein